MRKLVLGLVIALVALLAVVNFGLLASPGHEEEAAVRAAAQHYLNAHATGDPEEIRKVFRPELQLFWVKDGKLTTRSSTEFASGFSGKPAADEAQRKRRIASVDVAGDAAVVKIELDYPKAFFTDYISFLRIDGQWWAVNKTFTVKSKG